MQNKEKNVQITLEFKCFPISPVATINQLIAIILAKLCIFFMRKYNIN